jgi:hypothetical protein
VRYFILLGMMLSFWAGAQDAARGRVFHDQNGDGVWNEGEPGIAGVKISNGYDLSVTAEDGTWAIPVTDDTIVFMIKPPRWATPVNGDQIPQFHYIHKPAGSPPLDAPGVSPTGPLPASIDFPLVPQEEPDDFTVVVFGDTQARGMREVNFVTHDVVEEVIGTDARFGISLGDIVADDVNLFEVINASIGQIGIPWYNVFGNHDHNRGATDNVYADETFERVYGPSTYAFEYANAVFIILNNVYFEPTGRYSSQLTENQLTFLENYLATVPKDRLVTLYMHIPIARTRNKVELYRLLKDFPHTLSIGAHAHEMRHVFQTAEDGWLGAEPHHHFVNATVSGSWWCGTFDEVGIPHATMNDGAPNGYSFLDISGNQYKIRFKPARRPANYQMNIYTPDDVEAVAAGDTEVLANIFAGSEKSTARMKLGDGDWIEMQQTEAIDPECLRMHLQNPYLNEEVFGWKMDYPSKTRHMWKANLPSTPAPGTYTLTVESTDMFGQVHTGRRILRIQ